MASKQPQRTKRQRYVPRCYLSRFSKDGKSVWALDKFSKKKFEANVMGVAQEHGFYDLPMRVLEKVAPEERDAQAAEKALAAMEGGLVGRIERLLDEVRRGRLTKECQRRVSLDIAIQWLRTRQSRETFFEATEKACQAVADALVEKNFPDLARDSYPKVVCDRGNLPAAHVGHMFDEDTVVALAVSLMCHVWVVGENVTSQPFYTSDHPVVKQAHAGVGGVGLTGFRSPGIEIAFPLSSRHILVLYEKSVHRQMVPCHGQAVKVNAVGVEYFNRLQVRRSCRQVYCEADQFEQAEEECARFPESCDPNRARVETLSSADALGLHFRE